MKSVLFASIIATIFVSGGARKCYSSVTIDKPFNISTPSTLCLNDKEPCTKVTIGLRNGTEMVGRGCLRGAIATYEIFLGNEFNDVTTSYDILSYSSTYFCYTDNCNGSQSIIAVFSIIFASLFMFMFTSY